MPNAVSNADTERCWHELAALVARLREPAPAHEALAAIAAAVERVVGSRMLTFLRFDRARGDMERVYCTRPDRYPIGARKALRGGPWSDCVIERGTVFIASGADEMRAAFPDHAALAALECLSTMCVPVRYGGRTFGTMNLSGEEARYGARESALAQPFAALAVPALSQGASG